ncbi:MAG: hypothetical protein ACK4HW_02215 [Roseinatronobacter sp.]
MSNPDSFINEVTEELRRDQALSLIRRYGWIVVLAVVLIVGGAAWNEWRKASARASAQAFGDAVLAALDRDTPAARLAALETIPASGAQGGLLNLMRAGQLFESNRDAALAALLAASNDAALPESYRQLAALKHVIAAGSDLPAAERRDTLDRLAQPGQPFRPLALEQIALLHLEAGETSDALAVLTDLQQQADVSDGLRRRIAQLTLALGAGQGAN